MRARVDDQMNGVTLLARDCLFSFHLFSLSPSLPLPSSLPRSIATAPSTSERGNSDKDKGRGRIRESDDESDNERKADRDEDKKRGNGRKCLYCIHETQLLTII